MSKQAVREALKKRSDATLELYDLLGSSMMVGTIIDMTDCPWYVTNTNVCWWDDEDQRSDDHEEGAYAEKFRGNSSTSEKHGYVLIDIYRGGGIYESWVFDSDKEVTLAPNP